ncbi:MAG: hypothetical protein LW712_11195 [Burkholderiaceae bacterium]|nr:hypothetical protein [Burkholderiaceae bacterium]
MAYITTNHGVGDIVYAYTPESDTVQRLRVTAVHAESCNADAYGRGDFSISYSVRRAMGEPSDATVKMAQDALHNSPRDAFPQLPAEEA